MKTNLLLKFTTVALGMAALTSAGYAQDEQAANASLPPANAATATAATTTVPGPATTAQVMADASPDASLASWFAIKDCTYDMRAQFFVGFNRMLDRVDLEIGALTAKRAAMKSTANTQDWDFAMKEMRDARSNLKSAGAELSTASPATWAQEKDKVDLSWKRAQKAFANVKASTTN